MEKFAREREQTPDRAERTDTLVWGKNAVTELLNFVTEFERIGDYAVNIMEKAEELYDKEASFSESAKKELQLLDAALERILVLTDEAFENDDTQKAAQVEPLEEIIDGLCDEMKSHHVVRLQSGVCTLGQGFIFNDLLTNYERVADHCSNIAVAMIELESDSFDTHEYVSSVRAMKSHSFARYYEEYQEKYHL